MLFYLYLKLRMYKNLKKKPNINVNYIVEMIRPKQHCAK